MLPRVIKLLLLFLQACFASDLADATRKQLERGERSTEIMKQKQYSPMSVAAMGVSLFATNEGYLDDVEVNKVVDFEQALQSHIKSQHAGLLDELNQNQAYDDEVAAKLHEAVKDFKENGAW